MVASTRHEQGGGLKKHIVLYRTKNMPPVDPPLGFPCDAEDTVHAEEQCLNAYPDCEVVWIVETDSYEKALNNYWEE